MRPAASMRTALVVVEPASSPKKTGPEAVSRSAEAAISSAWRRWNSSSSCSLRNRGSRRCTSFISASTRLLRLSRNSPSRGKGCCFSADWTQLRLRSAEKAAPAATKSWESGGATISSSFNSRVVTKRWRSWSKKCSGPPKKATLPRMGLPQARPEIVWLTTAWKMLAAMSSRRAPSLMRGCTSVLAKTPQRAAMG